MRLIHFTQKEIETRTCEVTKELFDEDVSSRMEKKVTRIKDYVTDESTLA